MPSQRTITEPPKSLCPYCESRECDNYTDEVIYTCGTKIPKFSPHVQRTGRCKQQKEINDFNSKSRAANESNIVP